jgi:hypothetical protein
MYATNNILFKLDFFLSKADTERLIHVFITSWPDYWNALLYGLPKKAIGQLQNIQNAAARVPTKTRRRAHYTGFKVSALAACEF